jgi:hypothetical protein
MNGSPLSLAEIETRAAARGLLLRIKLGGALGITTLRVVVARPPLMLGELKGWALPSRNGLQLDTMRVQGERSHGVGLLIWAATFAWALEASPCRQARLLAICDDPEQHRRLLRYFTRLGFEPVRSLGAGLGDFPLRLVWGGAGLLMRGDCAEGLQRCSRLLQSNLQSDQSR